MRPYNPINDQLSLYLLITGERLEDWITNAHGVYDHYQEDLEKFFKLRDAGIIEDFTTFISMEYDELGNKLLH